MALIQHLNFSTFCEADSFVEETFDTIEQCSEANEPNIDKFGYVCGCRRSDGIFLYINKNLYVGSTRLMIHNKSFNRDAPKRRAR